jgi:hypothetical protein
MGTLSSEVILEAKCCWIPAMMHKCTAQVIYRDVTKATVKQARIGTSAVVECLWQETDFQQTFLLAQEMK